MRELAYLHDDEEAPEVLKESPFLKSFTKGQVEDILNASNLVECDEGDVVLDEGKEAHRLFMLLAGTLDVVKGGEHVATLTETGDVFGELATINDSHRSATVIAREKTYCLAIDHKFIEQIRPKEENPAFYAALYGYIARILAQRLKRTTEDLARMEHELHELKKAGDQ